MPERRLLPQRLRPRIDQRRPPLLRPVPHPSPPPPPPPRPIPPPPPHPCNGTTPGTSCVGAMLYRDTRRRFAGIVMFGTISTIFSPRITVYRPHMLVL